VNSSNQGKHFGLHIELWPSRGLALELILHGKVPTDAHPAQGGLAKQEFSGVRDPDILVVVFKQGVVALLQVDAQVAHRDGLRDRHGLAENFTTLGGHIHPGEHVMRHLKVRLTQIGSARLHKVPTTGLTIPYDAIVIGDVPNGLVQIIRRHVHRFGEPRLAHTGAQHVRKGCRFVLPSTAGTLARPIVPPPLDALLQPCPLKGCPLVDDT
jgi:hypothetical protein